MSKAYFGRMKLGKCVKSDLGFLGCYINVLPKMDQLCTGRQSCEIQKLAKTDFEDVQQSGQPCRDGLEPYLDVQFTCVEGQ